MALTLNDLKKFHGRKGPLMLVIMDGVGIGPKDDTDAVFMAKTPNLDRYQATEKLYCRLKAHGPWVGLPSEEDMGNSEVGHNALGAGRIIAQGAKRINAAIKNGEIFETEIWEKIIRAGKAGGTVHFIGLLSDGNVHSNLGHMHTMARQLAGSGVARVRVHALLDGRDVGERTAPDFLEPTEQLLAELSRTGGFDYRIGSGGGRMKVTMDRYEADWEIVKRGWETHVLGIGRHFHDALTAVRTMYDEGLTDQFLDAFVIVDDQDRPIGTIQDGDAVIFYNYRGDRAIELTRAFVQPEFDKFDRGRCPRVVFAGMMQYDPETNLPPEYLVQPPKIKRTISEYLVSRGVTMFALSETQKFGHVTYFWNGNRSGYVDQDLEDYFEIPSDRIEFQKKPEMKAREIADKTIELLRSGRYRFGRINLANGDMVGHSGFFDAAVQAVEVVDREVGRIEQVVRELGGVMVVTADHGNSDQMYDTDKKGKRSIRTAHSLNPVPFWIIDAEYRGEYEMNCATEAGLANIAATLLNLLGFEAPRTTSSR